MRTLPPRPEELRIQSFPTSSAAQEYRGTQEMGMNTVGKTCGNPPDTYTCEEGRDAPTRIQQCCV